MTKHHEHRHCDFFEKHFLSGDKTINTQDDWGYTPVNTIVKMGAKNILPCALNSGADLTIGDDHGHTPLFHALEEGDPEIFDTIFENVKEADNLSFKKAVHMGKPELYKKMLTKKSDLSEKDSEGYTVVDYALEQDDLEIMLGLFIKGLKSEIDFKVGDHNQKHVNDFLYNHACDFSVVSSMHYFGFNLNAELKYGQKIYDVASSGRENKCQKVMDYINENNGYHMDSHQLSGYYPNHYFGEDL